MFEDRNHAGMQLSSRLEEYRSRNDVFVVGIPRGGVVVADAISHELKLPLTIISVKKLAAPGNPELAIGAVCANGERFIDWGLALRIGVEQQYLDQEISQKLDQAKEREKLYEIESLEEISKNRNIVILVDDGVATGATVLGAKMCISNKKLKTVLVVPVIAKDVFKRFKKEFDQIVSLEVVDNFGAVGQYYREFSQVSDEEVINILKEHKHKNI